MVLLRSIYIIAALGLLFSSCQTKTDWTTLQLGNVEDEQVSLAQYSDKSAVFIFLSPECPLCQSYSVKINQLMDQHTSDSLQFVGVVGGTFYPKNEIKRFQRKYELMELPVLLDPEFELVEALDAEITPEVVYTDGRKIVYQGAIDDWAIDLGQKRLEVNRDYLHEAITAHQQGNPVDPNQTEAVGCFIE